MILIKMNEQERKIVEWFYETMKKYKSGYSFHSKAYVIHHSMLMIMKGSHNDIQRSAKTTK